MPIREDQKRNKQKKKHLPLDVVFPIEDLLQESNESKCANEYETKRSVAEDVFPRRGVDICHPSAQHPADGDTRSGVSPRCIQDRHRCCFLPSARDNIHHFAFFQAIFFPHYHRFHAATSPPRITSIGRYDRSCAKNQRSLLPANDALSVDAAKAGGGKNTLSRKMFVFVVFLDWKQSAGSIECESSKNERSKGKNGAISFSQNCTMCATRERSRGGERLASFTMLHLKSEQSCVTAM